MSMEGLDAGEVALIRSVVEGFIGARLNSKLEKLGADEHQKREHLQQEYGREAWLENAAKRVGQIRLVTHAVKYSHPDARGSSVHYAPPSALPEPLVSSAGELMADDVVGNAAALDVFKFLKLESGGQTVLQLARSGDAALKAAFCADPERARAWCQAFAGITEDADTPSSHTLAKQLYFPLAAAGDDRAYHLLAPLYPTSLAHKIHLRIQQDRFSDESKAARDARKKGEAYPSGYREYPNLASRAFGGSKPQNISQLNSERGGVGYLLPSCPPVWNRQPLQPPTRTTTVFNGWLSRSSREIRDKIKALKAYLDSLPPDRSTVHLRDARERYVQAIIDDALHIAAGLRDLPPGWSADPACKLDAAEAYWLDPHRAYADADFASQASLTDWQQQVSHRFGNWLNHEVGSDRLPMGDPEQREWKKMLEEELQWLSRELRDE
ncbi:type I-F CRISPR-associated protein Csy1 [Hydrocarboniphaga sp.]|uniref:type I-F CRISPR-associated protein Csy1 n=1 Tax=Hydrocarboniphaga sp. TaxID=2033016 RepID=UPI003D0D61D2